MLTMIDQIYDRNYQGARLAMNSGAAIAFEKLFASMSKSFKVLNRIEFDAPWTARRSRTKAC